MSGPVHATGSSAPAGSVQSGQQAQILPVPPAPAPAASGGVAADPADEPALSTQLATPIAALAARGDGSHVVTVRVTPEHLGTVTVRAEVTGGTMKVELFAADQHARDAIAAILPDLRSDLAAGDAGSGTTLGLGGSDLGQSAGGGTADSNGSNGSNGSNARSPQDLPAAPTIARPSDRFSPTDRHVTSPAGRLDVLA